MRLSRLVPAILATALFSLGAQAQGTVITITPEHPTTRDFIRIQLAGGFSTCYLDWFGPGVAEGNIVLSGYDPSLFPTCPSPGLIPIDFEGGLGPLPAGTYRLVIDIQGWELPRRVIEVREPEPVAQLDHLDLYDGRFKVSAVFDPPGEEDEATAGTVELTPRTGYFWFFHPENVELTVKLLDARAINGRFWFFLGSMTNRGFRVTVTDVGDGTCLTLPVVPSACPTYTFEGSPGVNHNIIDFETVGSLPPPGAG